MAIRWITFEEAQSLAAQAPREELQPIVLPVDRELLVREIPVAPKRLESDGLFEPYPVDSWYGLTDARVIVIEFGTHQDSITVASHFPRAERGRHDWESLKEFVVLPTSIDVLHPIFVGSRSKRWTHFVYRRQAAGWDLPLYRASSRDEAESLLAYLQQVPGNELCFVGEAETRGEWEVIEQTDGVETRIARFSEMSSALRLACTRSLRSKNATPLIVRNARGDGLTYRVESGRAIPKT